MSKALINRRNMGVTKLADDIFTDLVDGFVESFAHPLNALSIPSYDVGPRSNVVTTSDGVRIDIEAPGMKRSDFRVSIEGDTLTVSSHVEKKAEHEFYKRSFTRRWALNASVEPDKVTAAYEDGILRVMIPTRARSGPAAIDVEVK